MGKLSREPLDDETTIDMELVSQKSVEKWLKLFKLWDGTSKLELKQKVIILESFFTRVFDPGHYDTFPGLREQISTCDDGEDPTEEAGCHAEFHSWLPNCPFCTGSASTDEEQKSDAEIAEHLLHIEGTKVRAAKKAPPSPIEPKIEEKTKARPLALVPPLPPEEPEQEEEEDADIPGTEIIEPQTNGTIATVEELNAAVERVVNTYTATRQNWYECAVEIKEIHERQLWRQRRGPDGQPLYKHFNNFVEAELAPRGITRVGAYSLKSFADKFSREEFEKLGPAKMNVLVSLDDVPRKQLTKETIEKDLPVEEVRGRKQAIKPSSGRGGVRGAKPSGKGTKVLPTPESDQAFTMVFPSSSFSITMVASKGTKAKNAKKIEDLPVGEIVGINGMKLRLALTQQKDGTIQVSGFLVREK